MSKDPAQRFPSMQALAATLEALSSEAAARDRKPRANDSGTCEAENLATKAVARYEIGGAALRDGITQSPYVSLTYGASGIAYALCRIAKRKMRADLLAAADVWIEKGYSMSKASNAFYDDEMGINPSTVGSVSLFHSASGLDVVRGLVSIASGDLDTAAHAIKSFRHRSAEPCEQQDMTLGCASVLLGAAEILEACVGIHIHELSSLRDVGDQVSAGLTGLLEREQVATSVEIPALGLAHGWAGLIFALLRWNRATRTVPNDIVATRLKELWTIAEPHAGGLRWPVYNHARASGFMDGWCNGTAGHLMMNALALEVLGWPKAAEMVELCARSVWSSRIRVGSLCCGLAGMSYGLVTAYRVTGSSLWLDRARELARLAALDENRALRDSLYKGELGVVLLLDDLENPLGASMPLVQPSLA
jgi:serine/threonine-protein kinase